MSRWERTTSKAVSMVGMDALTAVKAIMSQNPKERTREDIRTAALDRELKLRLNQIQVALDWYKQDKSIASDMVCGIMVYKWVGRA